MNLKFSFFIPSLLTKGTKLKISFFLSRGTLYTYFLTIKTHHLFRLLPSTFHSFFSPLPLFTFFILSSNFFFPYPCNHFSFSTRTKISPPHELSLTNSNCARSKHQRNLFSSLFTHFWTFLHISYTRERKIVEAGKGVGEKNENVRPLYLIAPCRFPCIFSIFRFHPPWNRDDDRYPRDSTNFSLHELAFSAFSFLYGPPLEIDILLEVVVPYKERKLLYCF